MDQTKKEVVDQVNYKGRWVDKRYFRVFVYGINCEKLANSYDEFKDLIDSGEWYEDPVVDLPIVKSKARKPKDDGNG